MHLVDHWVIGFSGKRQLSNPEGVRVAIRRVLEELHSDFGRRRVLALPAIAFLAEGNDAFIRRDLPGQISQKQTARVCRFVETHFNAFLWILCHRPNWLDRGRISGRHLFCPYA